FAFVAEQCAHFEKRSNDKDGDSRSPDRSVASPGDQCSPSNGVPARRIHLYPGGPLRTRASGSRAGRRRCSEGSWQERGRAWAVEDVCSHDCTVFSEGVGQSPAPSTSFFRYRKLRCQTCNLGTGKPEHKVFWETFAVTFDGLVKPKRWDAIDSGEISIQHNFLAPNLADEFIQFRRIRQLPFFHAK